MTEISAAREHSLGYRRPIPAKPRTGTSLEVVRHSTPDGLLITIPTERETTSTDLASSKLEDAAPSVVAIQQQLAHMLQSSIFIHSDRISRFLRFIVEHVIRGTQSFLKEYVIGSEVYDRRPPYHPNQDSIVRTEARRLRGKLKEYYETEGKDDPVYIYLRPGSYIPVFQHNATLAGTQGTADCDGPFLSEKTSTIAIGILPFHDISNTPISSGYALGIPDELAYTLMRNEGCRVISPVSMARFYARGNDLADTMSEAGVQIAVEGCVKAQGNQIRITARIVDATGFQLWTKRFDTDADSQTVFTTEEEIAAALSAGFDALFGASKRPNFA